MKGGKKFTGAYGGKMMDKPKKKFDPKKAKMEVDAMKADMKKKSRAKYGGRFGDNNPYNNPNRRGKTTAKGLAMAKKKKM